MSKAVLVMDMPNSCSDCICRYISSTGKTICRAKIEELKPKSDKRPDWCPLKPIPQKKDICGTYNSEYYANGGIMPSVKIGYNACIDELLKGEEG